MSEIQFIVWVVIFCVLFFLVEPIARKIRKRRKRAEGAQAENDYILSQLQDVVSTEKITWELFRGECDYHILCPDVKIIASFKTAIPFERREIWNFSFTDIRGDSIIKTNITDETFDVIKKHCLSLSYEN